MADEILRREGENLLNEVGEVVARFEANNIIGDFGGTANPWTQLISNPVTSDGNITFELNESINNYNELLIEVGYYESYSGTGYTHINSYYFGKLSVDRIKANYDNGIIGALDVSLIANINEYYCNWMLNFTDQNHVNIFQKIVKGFSPKTTCAIVSIQAR